MRLESYVCSVCGKKFSQDVYGDAQKHLLKHIGVYAEFIYEDSYMSYFNGHNCHEAKKWRGL